MFFFFLTERHNGGNVIATMYVDSSPTTINGKTYWRHLLRKSYREGGKVKHHTVANISKCSPEEIEAIRLALRHKKDLARWIESGRHS